MVSLFLNSTPDALWVVFFFFFLPLDQGELVEKKQGSEDAAEEDRKPRRKAYVHKPFLYSRYYSDSDDEITVEERRRSAVSCVKVEIFCFSSVFS